MQNSRVQDYKTPPVVVVSEFYDSTHPKREWVSNNYIDNKNYSSKSSYQSLLHYSGRETKSEAIEKKRLLGYLEYQNQELKVTSSGHFSQDGLFTNEQMKKEIKNNPKKYEVPKQSLVWSNVISFSKEFFEENQIMQKEDAYKILSKTMDKFFRDNHIDPKSMTWIGQFHVDTPHHFHAHLRIHQNRPGHFNRKTKRDEWRQKGKWSKSSLLNLRKNIEEVAIANKLQKENIFKIIGKRDMVKYEVLGTLKSSKSYSEFVKLAYELKESIPQSGRVQLNSKNIDVTSKIRLSNLTNKILSSNNLIEEKWKALQDSIDIPIDQRLASLKKRNSSKHTKAMIRAHESIRREKHKEVRDHIENQILKLVLKNNWRAGSTARNIKSFNKTNKKRYSEIAFNKSKNKSFKRFSKAKFWDPLVIEQERDTQKALVAIAKDLAKYKDEVSQQRGNYE